MYEFSALHVSGCIQYCNKLLISYVLLVIASEVGGHFVPAVCALSAQLGADARNQQFVAAVNKIAALL